jgi:hypothetical protein
MKKLAIIFCLGAQFFIYGNADAQTHLKIIQQNGKFGLKERGEKGKMILPCEYSRLDNFNNGYAIVAKNGLMGMIDSMGKIVVPVQYTAINNFRNGLALVKDNNGKYGYMNAEGKLVFEPVFEKAEEFFDTKSGKDKNSAFVTKDGKSGLIAANGTFIIQPEFEEMRDFNEGLAAVRKDGKLGFINMNGTLVIQPTFSSVEDFKGGMAKFTEDGNLWGYINKTGEKAIEAKYEEITEFSQGLAAFKEKGKWGFINAEGTVVVKPQYQQVLPFTEGLGLVYLAPKQFRGKYSSTDPVLKSISKDALTKEGWAFIDRNGEIVFAPYFEKAYNFKNGIALVTLKNGKKGYIDKRGGFTKF